MKKLLLLSLCGLLLPLPGFAQTPAEKINPSLRARMVAAPDDYQEVIIQLSDQEDAGAMLEYFEANKHLCARAAMKSLPACKPKQPLRSRS